MKKKPSSLSRREYIRTVDALYTAAGAISGRDKTKQFLKDLLTPSERVMLGRRILIAQMIIQGFTVDEIRARLGVGTTTIVNVRTWLEDEFPGYERAVAEMERAYKRRGMKPLSFAWLRRKYPLHFLLFNIAEELFSSQEHTQRKRTRTRKRKQK